MNFFYKIIVCIFVITSCLQNKQENPVFPYTADVVHMNPLQSIQNRFESPQYSLEPHTFQFLTNFKKLDGPYFKMHQGATLFATLDSIKILGGKNTKLNYIFRNNIIVPQDYSTLAMLSAYYQFDLIASQLYTLSGISIESMIDAFGKFEIFFEPSFKTEEAGLSVDVFLKKNAAYVPELHKFILFSRSNDEHVPFAMNLQVITHEFGHALWEYAFDHGKRECDRLSVEYAITGLNEGFADFFSYTLTGSTNVIKNSLNQENLVTMRNFSLTNFNYTDIAETAEQIDNPICNQSQYCIGTLFANALFKAQKNLGYDQTVLTGAQSRSEFFTIITNALQNTKQNIFLLPDTPESFNTCTKNRTTGTYNGFVLGAFFQSFLNQIQNKAFKSELCNVLKTNFGSQGFPDIYQIGTCL